MTRYFLALFLCCGCAAGPMPVAAQCKAGAARPVAVISDFHMGLGRQNDKSWHSQEDFRWPNALKGFLDQLSSMHPDGIDLVIAGDFLELWQLPGDISCKGAGADLGCTIPEMKKLTQRIVAAHKVDLQALGSFAKRNQNRLHVIPGNHDSALLIPEVWKIVAPALDAQSGRVNFVSNGVWTSPDCKVLVEHGHQIGSDVNRYPDWPKVLADKGGVYYMVRPWGELFVQTLFNQEEATYPIIDNLSPETAGARYRMADRGLWKSAADVARFIAFNIFETSAVQRRASLGEHGSGSAKACVQMEINVRDYRLFAEALPADDPFRAQLEGKSPEASALQAQLTEHSKGLPEEDVAHLCAMSREARSLGNLLERKFVAREDIMRKHVAQRAKELPTIQSFIYGHTHQLEEAWRLRLALDHSVTVLNSGAFQRLIDEPGFVARVEKLGLKDTPHEGLRRITLESLSPCYGVVLIPNVDGEPKPEAMLWYQGESELKGRFVSPGNELCR